MSEEQPTKKLDVFAYLNSINNKTYLPPTEEEKGNYNQFIMNKGLSYYPDTILIVNEINRAEISDQWHYEFLYNATDKRNRRSQWFKPAADENLSLVMEYFGLNINKAKEILRLFSPEDFEQIKAKLQKGG